MSDQFCPVTDLHDNVTNLENLNNQSLRIAWRKAWGGSAPKGARKRFLMFGIAWKWQAEAHGGFSPELARRLAALDAANREANSKPDCATLDVASAARPGLGARLVRDWQGERYEVHVVEKGYLWRGQTYGSLSSVAKEITGVSRNGPKFFGLRNGQRKG